MSSRDLKTSKFSFELRTHEILMFSTHSMKYIWYSPQKSKYPLIISLGEINLSRQKQSYRFYSFNKSWDLIVKHDILYNY